MFNTSLNLTMVSCVLVQQEEALVYSMIIEKLHMWWKTGVSWHHISTCDFDYGPLNTTPVLVFLVVQLINPMYLRV